MIRLSDVFIPSVYGSYTAVDNPETSAFVQAGVIRTDPLLNAIARQGGKTFVVPFWKDIDPNIEPNYSNDDPADVAVPHGIQSGTMTARKSWLNQGFGEMDLVVELAGADPLQHVRNRFGTYWLRQQERRLIASVVGVMNDNVANDGGDMTVDISGAVGDAAKFGANAFVDAVYTAGENSEMFRAIAVHSMIEARMVKNDELDIVETAQGGTKIKTYKGRAVIVDDSLPVSGAGADRVYTSVLFGGGAIGFGGVEGNAFALGEGVPKVAAEVSRTAEAGNGGGMESIWERRTWMMHPFGFEWVESGAAMAEMSPTLADLRKAAFWNRVVDRKQVPLAFIKSKA
ncbi:hypothetical protein UFOVP131_37 [uncultured Caudovirales phage]|uniref:Coat protein n=1 Tax=uncultured Caudovirales phage TaxID=2100421 RepID=A0A6J5LEZ8_9CAUD|nr:hypothetical protein UFOVP131_37 [uncultured Caudovirales phage]